jgi:SecD/SecF fusion protein
MAMPVKRTALTLYAAAKRMSDEDGFMVAGYMSFTALLAIFPFLLFLAALLTIIGYTVNDTVVLFDRVREEWRLNPQGDFPATTNEAILNTLPRSLNTGLSTLFILVALLFLGGQSLSDFALALVLGVLIGTYSSNFTATPIAIELERRYPTPPPEPKRDKAHRGSREDPNYGAVV